MYSIDQIQSFLKSANIVVVSKATGISRPTLIALKKGDVNVNYNTLVKVNNYINTIFEDTDDE